MIQLYNLGLSMQFEIVGENLESVLLLPEKFRANIEGLAGNFNGDSTDDLVNIEKNLIVIPTNTSNRDDDVLAACLSCMY